MRRVANSLYGLYRIEGSNPSLPAIKDSKLSIVGITADFQLSKKSLVNILVNKLAPILYRKSRIMVL